MNDKAYHIKISIKSKVRGVQVTPKLITVLVLAQEKKQAIDYILQSFQRHFDGINMQVEIRVKRVILLKSDILMAVQDKFYEFN